MAYPSSTWSRILGAVRTAFIFGLLGGIVLFYPAWKHDEIKVESPIYHSEEAAMHWLRGHQRETAMRCLSGTDHVDTQRIADHSGYYARFRCKSEWAYVRIGFGFALPFLFMLSVLLLAAVGKAEWFSKTGRVKQLDRGVVLPKRSRRW